MFLLVYLELIKMPSKVSIINRLMYFLLRDLISGKILVLSQWIRHWTSFYSVSWRISTYIRWLQTGIIESLRIVTKKRRVSFLCLSHCHLFLQIFEILLTSLTYWFPSPKQRSKWGKRWTTYGSNNLPSMVHNVSKANRAPKIKENNGNIIKRLIVINIAPLTGLFCNCPLVDL